MDALVKAALDRVNESVNSIFTLKESDYPTMADLRRTERLALSVRRAERDSWKFGYSYEEAQSRAIAKAVRTVDALRSALKVVEPYEE